MFSLSFILLLSLMQYTSSDIIRRNNRYAAEFSVMNKGRLVYNILMVVPYVDLQECHLQCVMHLKCWSVNYNTLIQLCEIVDSDYDAMDAIKVDEGSQWRNYGTPNKQDGWYFNWTYSACSVTCGEGEQFRYRQCNEPQHGGTHCKGKDHEMLKCEREPCPINGGWSNWADWTTCSASCNNGTQMRNRLCDQPFPQYGGLQCYGIRNESRICNLEPCKDKECVFTVGDGKPWGIQKFIYIKRETSDKCIEICQSSRETDTTINAVTVEHHVTNKKKGDCYCWKNLQTIYPSSSRYKTRFLKVSKVP